MKSYYIISKTYVAIKIFSYESTPCNLEKTGFSIQNFLDAFSVMVFSTTDKHLLF